MMAPYSCTMRVPLQLTFHGPLTRVQMGNYLSWEGGSEGHGTNLKGGWMTLSNLSLEYEQPALVKSLLVVVGSHDCCDHTIVLTI